VEVLYAIKRVTDVTVNQCQKLSACIHDNVDIKCHVSFKNSKFLNIHMST